MIEFPFERRQSQRFGTILKPIIPVRLSGPVRAVNVFMLVDSGADLSILPYSVGETLGLQLDIGTRNEVQGIGEGAVPERNSKIPARRKLSHIRLYSMLFLTFEKKGQLFLRKEKSEDAIPRQYSWPRVCSFYAIRTCKQERSMSADTDPHRSS